MRIHSIYSFFMKLYRPSRLRFIRDRFTLINDPCSNILDVGGSYWPWTELAPAGNVIILNILPTKNTLPNPRCKFVQGDGTELQFGFKQFDLVFSNSVIEHVGDWEKQRLFAKEIIRCGKSIYLQTPNKWFFVEPHLIAPFIHWLPFSVARRLVRWLSIWGWVTRPSQATIDAFLSGIRLLTEKEVKKLFPNCLIIKERVLWMTKSFIVVVVE